MDIGLGRLAGATLSAALLALVFGGFALVLSCVSHKRGLSIGAASALGVAAYFVNALAPAVEDLDPFQKLSPFYYYIGADPLTNGLHLGHTAILIGFTIVPLVFAWYTFERRDLSV